MALFSVIAGIVVGAAASWIALPLWRSASALARGRMSYVLAGGFIASFALVAGILYLTINARHSLERSAMSSAAPAAASGASASSSGSAAKSMQDEVAGLEARLAREGGSPGDWSLLAQAYDVLGRPDDARRARDKAGVTSAGPGISGSATSGSADTSAALASPAIWQMGASALTAAAATVEKRANAPATVQGDAAVELSQPPVSALDLERRVATKPRDPQAWLALADLRRSARDYAAAAGAYQKVADLRAMSAQSWADYGDVLGSLADGSLAGKAGRAIDNALALDASNPKALWLKASQAHEQHRYAEALRWWKKLRSILPPDSSDARMVEANIAEASSLAGEPPAPAGAAVAAANTGSDAEVSGTVSLDTRFTARVQPDATLFVYARAADSPGPPLAVLRTTVGAWPMKFRLDDSMAMIPSRRLSQFDRIVIEARISRSGQATPASGDLYVTSPVLHPAPGTRLTLVINREIG